LYSPKDKGQHKNKPTKVKLSTKDTKHMEKGSILTPSPYNRAWVISSDYRFLLHTLVFAQISWLLHFYRTTA